MSFMRRLYMGDNALGLIDIIFELSEEFKYHIDFELEAVLQGD